MKTIDISKLSGDALFEALQSGSRIECRTPPKTVDRLAPTRTQSWKWADTELVLIETHVDCLCCGRRYSYPNDTLFLRRKADNGALHYTALEGNVDDPEQRFADLECVVESRRTEVRVCTACWDVQHIIDRARNPKPKTPPVERTELPDDIPELPSELDLPPDNPITLADLFQ